MLCVYYTCFQTFSFNILWYIFSYLSWGTESKIRKLFTFYFFCFSYKNMQRKTPHFLLPMLCLLPTNISINIVSWKNCFSYETKQRRLCSYCFPCCYCCASLLCTGKVLYLIYFQLLKCIIAYVYSIACLLQK